AVKDEIGPEPLAQDLLPLAVGEAALEGDRHQGGPHDDRGGEELPAHGQWEVGRGRSALGTRRSFWRWTSSAACTRLTPSPSERSMSRMLETRRISPPISTEAAWSLPHRARSRVMCRSTKVAPRFTAAQVGGSPVSCP